MRAACRHFQFSLSFIFNCRLLKSLRDETSWNAENENCSSHVALNEILNTKKDFVASRMKLQACDDFSTYFEQSKVSIEMIIFAHLKSPFDNFSVRARRVKRVSISCCNGRDVGRFVGVRMFKFLNELKPVGLLSALPDSNDAITPSGHNLNPRRIVALKKFAGVDKRRMRLNVVGVRTHLEVPNDRCEVRRTR